MKYYFAYGSCMDYEGRLKEHGVAGKFEKIGMAKLAGYRFRMNKLAQNGKSVFANIEPAASSNVYGILYEIADSIETDYLDRREGFPHHYEKELGKVTVGDQEYTDVIIYIANPKQICNNILPVTKKYESELKKGGAELPEHYKYEFLKEINLCVKARNNNSTGRQPANLYHDYGQDTEFIRKNPEFYQLIREMTIFFGNDNDVVNNSGVTPEMFRIMVKLTEMAARGALDLGHMIPRGLLAKLESEFLRIKN